MGSPQKMDLGETSRLQAEAADPHASVWVSANAGSGKTHVLINRVIRLLLSGTAPEHILCLTFTKAAAAEMASRLYASLGEWAVMEERELAEKLEALEGCAPDAATLLKARLLFARAIETPGGLKIQTIHAFCERLLGRFPLEAGISPHFDILDERTAAELMAEARDEILADIGSQVAGEASDPLAAAFELVSEQVGEYAFDEFFSEIVRKRASLREVLRASGSVEDVIVRLRKRVGLRPEETEQMIVEAVCAADAVPEAQLQDALPLLRAGNKTDIKTADALQAFLSSDERTADIDDLLPTFIKADGGPRKVTPGIVTKKVHEAHPNLLELMESEQERIVVFIERRRAARVVASTNALFILANALLNKFEALKQQHAYLDYEDLILKSRELLRRGDAAAWVLYKLDGGLDHILVDEAQDTSPHQWEVIEALAEEFLSGEGARDLTRTIFAVGDEKQSIFSFQGADPARFAQMRKYFAGRVSDAGKKWSPVDLLLSFRSTPQVLAAVDAVFATPQAAEGLNAEGEPPTHFALRDLDAGLVEIWPTCVPEEIEEAVPWDAPLDYPSSMSPEAQLAGKIAATIDHWLSTGEELKGKGRPICAGDVLILVRRRNLFVEEMIRALKKKGVPVAGTDRMVLTDQIAVMDLMALGAFSLLPEDDLTLATVLKSPLVGLSEEQLFKLAHKRKGTLWAELSARMDEENVFAEAHKLLSAALSRSDRLRPYEFFAELLVRDGGRQKLRARLGADVDDPVDEFLSLALAYERVHTPSLQGFLHWVEAGEAEVKREMGESRDEVRVMTVHGSKGLESEIVFLPDTCSVPGGQHDPRLFEDDGPEGPLILFSGRKTNDDAVTSAARESLRAEAMKEYRRLLYVAMTRAKDRLYVSGYESSRKPSPDCWYQMIEKALLERATETVGVDGKPVWRIEGAQRRKLAVDVANPTKPAEAPLPGWAARPPAPEPTPPRPLAPSKLVDDGDEPSVASPLQTGGTDRFKRGRLIHRLLQSLPDVELEKRELAAKRFLKNPGLQLTDGEQDEIAGAALAVIAEPGFAALFGPGSRAEVSLVGEITRKGEQVFLSGQIDRLCITVDCVWVVDFKTNRPPPTELSKVSPAYVAQLAGYCALLASLYPDRAIRAALLWTDGPRLMEIPAEMLENAL
jgi:ATP-dependent helicase/nuclease subunit A